VLRVFWSIWSTANLFKCSNGFCSCIISVLFVYKRKSKTHSGKVVGCYTVQLFNETNYAACFHTAQTHRKDAKISKNNHIFRVCLFSAHSADNGRLKKLRFSSKQHCTEQWFSTAAEIVLPQINLFSTFTTP